MMLLESSVRITLAALTVAAILAVLRVRSQALRHAIWTGVLAAMLLMPLLVTIAPSIAVPLPLPAPANRIASATNEWSPSPGPTLQSGATPLPPVSQQPDPRLTTIGRSHAAAVSIAPTSTVRWPWIAYGIGVSLAALWVAAGWIGTARLARRSRPVTLPAGEQVWESDAIAAPMTVGIFRPRILLPAGWRAWPADSVRACLAHEQAHVQRRDPIVALAARVNRCVFWFHPLAWWLPRVLAAAAEHVADDRAIAALGQRRRYAEVLLDIAEAVRRRGRRVAWQAMGIDGSGLLGARIHRVLEGAGVSEPSRGRRVSIVVACAAAVALAVACRAEPPAVAPLQPDPDVAKRRDDQKARMDEFEKSRRLSKDEIVALESSLTRTDADFDSLAKLKIVYGPSSLQTAFDWHEMIARRRPHIIWLVEHHPEHELADWPVSPTADPVGYAEVKKRWLAQSARPDVTAAVLNNAGRFFASHEPQQTEALWLRAKALDPDARTIRFGVPSTPASPRYWSSQLGYLYADAITGPRSPRDGQALRPLDADAYGRELRARLEQSDDAVMLAAAGQRLARVYKGADYQELGRRLLERAVKLDPQQENAAYLLAQMTIDGRNQRLREELHTHVIALAEPPLAEKLRTQAQMTPDDRRRRRALQEEALKELQEPDRLFMLADLTAAEYMAAEREAYTDKNQAAADESFARAQRYADAALALAAKRPGSEEARNALFAARLTQGAEALRQGDRPRAVQLMHQAADAPAPHAMRARVGISGQLVNALLKAGERESVAHFLERAALGSHSLERERILKDAAAIRAGRMPLSYQYLMAQ